MRRGSGARSRPPPAVARRGCARTREGVGPGMRMRARKCSGNRSSRKPKRTFGTAALFRLFLTRSAELLESRTVDSGSVVCFAFSRGRRFSRAPAYQRVPRGHPPRVNGGHCTRASPECASFSPVPGEKALVAPTLARRSARPRGTHPRSASSPRELRPLDMGAKTIEELESEVRVAPPATPREPSRAPRISPNDRQSRALPPRSPRTRTPGGPPARGSRPPSLTRLALPLPPDPPTPRTPSGLPLLPPRPPRRSARTSSRRRTTRRTSS